MVSVSKWQGVQVWVGEIHCDRKLTVLKRIDLLICYTAVLQVLLVICDVYVSVALLDVIVCDARKIIIRIERDIVTNDVCGRSWWMCILGNLLAVFATSYDCAFDLLAMSLLLLLVKNSLPLDISTGYRLRP